MANPSVREPAPFSPMPTPQSGYRAVIAKEEREAFESRRRGVLQEHEATKTLYWFGMLPGSDYGMFESGAGDEWSNPRKWEGRCKWFQALNIAGMEFTAYIEKPFKGNEGQIGLGPPTPGQTWKFSAEQVDKIKKAAFKTFVRPIENGARAQILKEDQAYYVASPLDIPTAKFVYMVSIESEREIPGMRDFFAVPPASLWGD